MSYDYTDSAYDDFLKDADRDNRVGDHDFMVSENIQDAWPSGDPRIKINGVLLTANNAKADLTLSPPPPPEIVKTESNQWETGKKKAIAQAISMYRVLATSYGVTPEQLKQGDILRVKTVKTRVDDQGKGGFIRIAVIKDKSEIGKKSTDVGTATAKAPF